MLGGYTLNTTDNTDNIPRGTVFFPKNYGREIIFSDKD